MSAEGVEDTRFLELADLFIDIAREIRLRASATTPVVPITQTQGQVMRYVHNHPGCSASDIAEGSGLQRANVSAALRELRGRDYITSRRDEVDGRAIRIEATPRADENIAKLRASWGALLEDAWAASSADAPGDTGAPDGTATHDDTDETLDTIITSLVRLNDSLGAGRASKAARLATPA